MKYLIGTGIANPAANNNEAIFIASLGGRTEAVKILLDHHLVDPSDCNNKAVRAAADGNHTDVLELLLQCSKVNPSVRKNSILHTMVVRGNVGIAQMILQHPKVNPLNFDFIFWECLRNGQGEAAELILQTPMFDIINGNSALRLASKKGCVGVVKLLLTNPRVYPADKNNDALRQASIMGYTEVVKCLLSDHRVKSTVNISEILFVASKFGNDKVVKFLLDCDDIDLQNSVIERAFQQASSRCHTKVVEVLRADPKNRIQNVEVIDKGRYYTN